MQVTYRPFKRVSNFFVSSLNRNRKVTFIVRLLLEDRRRITIKLKYKKTDTVKYS
jgi:hypothetical protein